MLQSVDLTEKLTRPEYDAELMRLQLQLRALAYQLYVRRRPLVIAFEGWDASGKGGAIKRLTERLDPRGYQVYPIIAPHGTDRTHHYLWRFWRRLKPPDEKQILIFDRSWYGRVLVERLEGFCTEAEWRRAYREINEFERQLVDFGTILVKFWIHISKDEQLRRFEERQRIHYKAWKLSDEDWRNRAKWDLYEEAANDMLVKTSTRTAPWTVVAGDDKLYSRIRTLETVTDVLRRELDFVPPEPVPKGGKKSKKDRKAKDKKAKKNKKRKVGKSQDNGPATDPAEAQLPDSGSGKW